jgi:23S rRNA (uracil1939-C5)-methyltransferase
MDVQSESTGMSRKQKNVLLPSIKITGIAEKGRGVGRTEEGRVVFVDDVVPGDIVEVIAQKKKRDYLEGKAKSFLHYSIDRMLPFCQHFGVCGGCKWQHLSYNAQLRHKQKLAEDALLRIGKVQVQEMMPILPAIGQTYYRNKLEFSFSSKRWLSQEELANGVTNQEDVLGFHHAGAFDKVVNIEHCFLQSDPSNTIRNCMRDLAIAHGLTFYDARTKEGLLRNVIIRVTTLEQVMVIVALQYDVPDQYRPYLNQLLKEFPQITTLLYCINPKVNDFIMDLDMILYHGKGSVEEQLGHVRFKIGPKSFFQTNTLQAQRLYDVIVEFAALQGTENVYDLYTGIGSIALYIAKNCKQVVGIEEIAAAIEDAKENAMWNGLQNTIFYAGDVKAILTTEFAAKHGKPDLLITDPPRAGMHPQVVEMLLQLESPKLIYVSCNPATQARDLNLLTQKYEVKKVRPVDMFPHTHHLETVALLELR